MRRALMLLTILLLAAVPAAAQRRGDAVAAANAAKEAFSEANRAGARAGAEQASPGISNRTVKVVVTAILEDGSVEVVGEAEPLRATIRPWIAVELVAQDRKQFGGRKKIGWGELGVGHRLKLTFRATSAELLKAKVLKDRAAG